MIYTKNNMAKMLVNETIDTDLPLENIKFSRAYNKFNTGEFSISDWFQGKNYTFFQYKVQNQTYPYLIAYDEKGLEVFRQEVGYHIHKLYIDEDGYFYGITTTNSTTTDYKLTLFNRVEETNSIHRRKSYSLTTTNMTHAPDVTKKDDSNYFIATIEDNIGGYRAMLIWQLTIDIKNGNQWKYWQNEFDHGKDNAEIKYSFDFSVENSTIIRFCFAETRTVGTSELEVYISRANLLLTDDNFNEQGTQKKTELLLDEMIDYFRFYKLSTDDLPKNYICMIDNNLFATLRIIRDTNLDNPTFQIKYWAEDEEGITAYSQNLAVEETFIPALQWNLKDKICSIVVPTKTGNNLSGQAKKCKIYIYIIEFENTEDMYSVGEFPYIPTFHLCKSIEGNDYIDYNFNVTANYGWNIWFNMFSIIKIRERWYVNLGILTRNKTSSSSNEENKAVNVSVIFDNVWKMKESMYCNVPEYMQVTSSVYLLAKMQTQYYEGADLVSVFNIPNNMENRTIQKLKFFDKYDQEFCLHNTSIEKNQYENVFINHRIKYRVINNGEINEEASESACKVLSYNDRGTSRWEPYIDIYRVIMDDETTTEGSISGHYTIDNNLITFTIPHAEGSGKIELLGNRDDPMHGHRTTYFTKEFTSGTSTTIYCLINEGETNG